jgi:phage terminase large subunit
VEGLLNEKDEYYRNVYTYGNWGILGDVIFTNWRIDDLSGMRDQFANRRNGLDFGFASHPAAISVSHYDADRKTIYIYDELYETGLTNDLLSDEAKRMCGTERITGDSAEPKSIDEIRSYGINILPTEKGKDSVSHNIQLVQDQRISVTKQSVNVIKEYRNFLWVVDKDGKVLNEPEREFKHSMDATAYAISSIVKMPDIKADLENFFAKNLARQDLNNTR